MRTTIFITVAAIAATFSSADSLWTSKKNNETSMFADRIATNIGDILLIQVSETTTMSRNVSKTTATSTNISHSIDSFFYPASQAPFGASGGNLPNIKLAPTDSFTGEGSYSDTNVLKSKASVLVVDVLPNGNLVVEGARKVEVQGEAQYMVLRGIVRRDDVMKDNSVYSYNVVNANVEVLGEGDLVTAQRKGWINKLLDAANVF